MTDMSESYLPDTDRSNPAPAFDPRLLELGLSEVRQDNARLRQIIAELLIKNQALRWALQSEGMTHLVDIRWMQAEEAA